MLDYNVCTDTNAPFDAIYNCTMTCDPNNRTLVLEQCAGLAIPDDDRYIKLHHKCKCTLFNTLSKMRQR